MKTIFTILCLIISFHTTANSNQWEGQPFAKFELADQNGALKTNADFNNKWKVVYFYPKDRTPGCTVEAQNFVDDYAQYQANNIEIIGVSYDDVESHKDFAETYEMKFTLLADVDKKLAKAMGVDRIIPWPHASRQTFIVNPEGIIVKYYEDVSPNSHSKELLTDFQTLIAKK